MKKIIIIFSLFAAVNLSARNFDIFNYTAYNFNYQINTCNSSTFSYPLLWSTNTLLILTPAMTNAHYTVASGFPFNSTGSPTPPVISWVRKTSATATATATSNSMAQLLFGSSQTLSFLKFFFSGVPLSGNFGPHGDFTYMITIADKLSWNILPLEVMYML